MEASHQLFFWLMTIIGWNISQDQGRKKNPTGLEDWYSLLSLNMARLPWTPNSKKLYHIIGSDHKLKLLTKPNCSLEGTISPTPPGKSESSEISTQNEILLYIFFFTGDRFVRGGTQVKSSLRKVMCSWKNETSTFLDCRQFLLGCLQVWNKPFKWSISFTGLFGPV